MIASILLVDDDVQALESTKKILTLSGYHVETAADGQEALERLVGAGELSVDLVLTDVRMPRMTGLEFLQALSISRADLPVVLMTAYGKLEDAVWAMKLGAVDFLSKPFKRQALLDAVQVALKRKRGTRPGGAKAASVIAERSSIETLVMGESFVMRELRKVIQQVAATTATVLISGESGTGKERVSRALHLASPRAKGQFVAINCAALPENLLESELFGHEKGAFSGALSAKPGLFEVASGGTLLLDEIGDMPLPLQVKLLRVIQEGEVRRVGGTQPKKVDVRLLAASHRELRTLVNEGLFRQDLLFRLEVVSLRVPPLRERRDDIPLLALHFLNELSTRHGKELSRIADDCLQALEAHVWPGNVRELQNVIERAVVFASSNELKLTDLPPHLLEVAGQMLGTSHTGSISIPLGTSLKDVEELLIKKTLEATKGDKNVTAKLLGINSRTIYRKLKGEDVPVGEE